MWLVRSKRERRRRQIGFEICKAIVECENYGVICLIRGLNLQLGDVKLSRVVGYFGVME